MHDQPITIDPPAHVKLTVQANVEMAIGSAVYRRSYRVFWKLADLPQFAQLNLLP